MWIKTGHSTQLKLQGVAEFGGQGKPDMMITADMESKCALYPSSTDTANIDQTTKLTLKRVKHMIG